MDPEKLRLRVKGLQIDSKKILEGIFSGNFRTVFRGQGMEFNDVREYVEGDDIRSIDWNVSSRIGSPYTKTFREEREVTIFLIVDFSASLKTGTGPKTKRETATMLFSLLSFAAVENDERIGALFFTDTVEKWVLPKKGKSHVLRLLQDMLQFTPKGRGSNLSNALYSASETLKQRGICIILSDFKTSGYFRHLVILSKRHDIIAVRLSDPEEYQIPPAGRIPVIDPETHEMTILDTKSSLAREKYAHFWSMKEFEWKRVCGRRKIRTLTVSTHDDPAKKLIEFFRLRGRA
jgi:uncharacterized protein (DUF58 family)